MDTLQRATVTEAIPCISQTALKFDFLARSNLFVLAGGAAT